jgi:hypothetical protein
VVEGTKLLLEYRVEYGKRGPIRSAFTAPRVMKSPLGLPTPIAGTDGRFSGEGASTTRLRLTVRKDD